MKSTWQILSQINCNEHTEKKNGLTYLSWAWAWGIVKENFPDANYEVIKYNGVPYLFDSDLGYLVTTRVTINSETIEMSLPVMDGANHAKKAQAYTMKIGKKYEVTVEPATMFDINTSIMRCLTKNLAMFGLGHYIYAGEDIPCGMCEEEKLLEKRTNTIEQQTNEEIKALISQVGEIKTMDDLKAFWLANKKNQKNEEFKNAVINQKNRLKNGNGNANATNA